MKGIYAILLAMFDCDSVCADGNILCPVRG